MEDFFEEFKKVRVHSEKIKEQEDRKHFTTNLKSFHYMEDGSVTYSILDTRYTKKYLNSGVYNIFAEDTSEGVETRLSVYSSEENLNTELDFFFEDKISIIFNKFFDASIKDKVNKLGYNHKVGILLYGKQGTGKTSMFKKYFNLAVEKHNAIVFNVSSPYKITHWWGFIKKIRLVQDNPIIVFMDEFDDFVGNDKYDYESELKRILDGVDSIDNCFFMAATNYINDIPTSIKDRPSRFKYCIEIGGADDLDLIRKFLKDSFDKVGINVNFDKEVEKMKGWTIDELKEWVLDKVLDVEFKGVKKNKIGF